MTGGDTASIMAGTQVAYSETTGEPYFTAELRFSVHNSSTIAQTTARIVVSKLDNSSIIAESVCTDICVGDTISRPFTINPNGDFEGSYVHFNVPDGAEPGLFLCSVIDTNNPSNKAEIFVLVSNNPLGIEPAQSQLEFSAFPNPATQAVSINYQMNEAGGELLVSDLLGHTVMSLPLKAAKGNVTLDVSNLPKGIYIYSIRQKGINSAAKKLIVR